MGELKDKNCKSVINYKYKDGSIYTGDTHNGLRQGKGKQIWKDGSSYEGKRNLFIFEEIG